ncbi:amino acid permease/ SLC12A domain-containing protein [Radiomyces spectabilis]|uniref:amino acid permease/ SLC12A domain-containing protein n=1 Tax=Radiomyces spectabilis TaxID=64574 RepID=UPI00221F928D|nr:amino acid permease/ SLC12A domain-containing protein [Radiomyces spectabilis]KAI8374182.1 amino acid permease/ SLC12A domain-containing protein [Radiomyces spectabilis]
MEEKLETGNYYDPYRTYSGDGEKIENYNRDPTLVSVESEHNNDIQQGTKRGLNARHIQMISLGGAIGTGLFLNSGGNIAEAGPAGALIAYCIVGFMVYCMMTCLGEMATFLPVSGSFSHYATRFIEPAWGFALGWNYWFSWAVTIATELSAAATIINWWRPVMPDAAWSAIFLVLIIAINLFGVRIYGELEYWFALIKILIVIVFVIIAICVTTGGLGGHVIGFEYWKDPGAFANGVLGTISVLLAAGFSFQGTEIVGITAGEAKNPTKTVPRAIRNTFWRIIFFYLVTIFLLGLCIPNTDPDLASSADNAAVASFTLVFKLAGIEAGAHVINAIILTSVLSAANSSLYTCSRMVMALARDGNAPRILSRVNKHGSPHWAVLFSSVIGFACVFVSIYSASEGFVWFLSITAVTGFISWWGVAVVHLRFRRAYVRQGRDLKDLTYKSMAHPFSALFAAILSTLIILGQGYIAFYPKWNTLDFFKSYIGLVPVVLCYVGFKIFGKSKVVPLDEVDFDTGRVTHLDEEDEEEAARDAKWWMKLYHALA